MENKMGREIRRVPPHWEHPRRDCHHFRPCNPDGKCLQPLYDRDYETELADWLAKREKWKAGGGEGVCAKHGHTTFEEWHGKAPDPNYYRPAWTDEERTWFQVYETVSEGTPVTPAFATKEELVDYLVNHGDFWDQKRGNGGWERENAEKFVGTGWAPSMMIVRNAAGVEINEPRDGIC